MSRMRESAGEMIRAGTLARVDLAAVSRAPSVDPFDAIRTMGLRLQCLDLASKGGIEIAAREVTTGVGWRVTATAIRSHATPPKNADEIELLVKSDVGALELAGHSIHLPRQAADPVETRPSMCPMAAYAPTWIATAPSAYRALQAIRCSMAGMLDERIRRALAALRELGRDLDLGAGWTPPGPVVFTVPGETVPEMFPGLPVGRRKSEP